MKEKPIVGTANIPLEEWVSLRVQARKAQILMDDIKEAMKHVELLLTSLTDEKVVVERMQEINDANKSPIFRVIDGKIRIQLPTNETKEDSETE
jgi:hypothetical protein